VSEVEAPGRRQKILEVFEADLPAGLRCLDAAAITEEIEHGRNVTVQDDELASEETYDKDVELLAGLVEDGILQAGDAFGYAVFGFTLKHQEKLEAEGKIGVR
jgi:hypothetical protein